MDWDSSIPKSCYQISMIKDVSNSKFQMVNIYIYLFIWLTLPTDIKQELFDSGSRSNVTEGLPPKSNSDDREADHTINQNKTRCLYVLYFSVGQQSVN